jgi:tRNA A22 N-methylase
MGFSLSDRLKAAADMVTPGSRLADIGTDHAYLPIWLVAEGRCPAAIAADLRQGPLLAAQAHVCEAGLGGVICLRLSDGLKEIAPGEADTITITGMGGPLICRILADGRAVARSAKELILSPQSDVPEVRRFLLGHGFIITDETMVREDGKYYVIIKAEPDEDVASALDGGPEARRRPDEHAVDEDTVDDGATDEGDADDGATDDGATTDDVADEDAVDDSAAVEGASGGVTVAEDSIYNGDTAEVLTDDAAAARADKWSEEELAYGRFLIRKRSQVFLDYLDWRIGKLREVRDALAKEKTERTRLRLAETEADLERLVRLRFANG